jgi:hypothetical protein
VSCPYCHADNRTDITYSCWTKVGDDELARSERCLRNEIKQHKERIRRLEEAGDALLWYFCPKNTGDISFLQSEAIKQWNKAKEAKL